MKKVFTHSEISAEEKIYLRKDFLGWRVVDPLLDKEGKPIDSLKGLKNISRDKWNMIKLIFGGKRMFIYFLIGILVYTLVYLGIQEQIENYRLVMSNPCAFCESCQNQCRELVNNLQVGSNRFSLNLTNLNLSQ